MRKAASCWPLAVLIIAALLLLNACSNEAVVTRRARAAFEQQLHVSSSISLGVRTGGECAVAVFRTADGRRRGVALARDGAMPLRWQVFGVSAQLRLTDFVDDAEAGCGLVPGLRSVATPAQHLSVMTPYRYTVRGSCTGPQLRVDGSVWPLATPWHGDHHSRPATLAGHKGTLRLVTVNRAVLIDPQGRVARFTRSATGVSSPPCD